MPSCLSLQIGMKAPQPHIGDGFPCSRLEFSIHIHFFPLEGTID